ncbi:hypothetical protein [Streptomyces sp. STR69]|uniref:hypothetical protein n=1 Tax=Streptomyces sp. STR69 TaxID=1796942 RepID=UPI003967CC9D
MPGTRPEGAHTTGELQQSVHLYRQRIGTRVVVVGAEDVSYWAADAARAAGAEVVAMVTEFDRSQTTPARAHHARLRHRDGRTAQLARVTVVFTGGFVSDHELARFGGLVLDPGTRSPAVGPVCSPPAVCCTPGRARPPPPERALVSLSP